MLNPHPLSGTAFAGLRIGLLGGSFNPAHAGHRAISLYALKRLGLDQIWWMVSPQNPLKATKGMAPLAQRVVAARDLAQHPSIHVTAIEAKFGTRYTIDTLDQLQLRFPRTNFVWLMGADNLRNFHHWHRWEDVFTKLPVAVFRRPDYAAGRGVGKAAQRFDAAWRSVSAGRNLAGKKTPAWLVMDNPMNPFSATKLRKNNSSWLN